MCGLTGFYYPTRKALLAPMQADLNAMTASLQHRGPDAAGTWLDQEGGIALGHRRLAVQDLSPQGSQPMVSATGRRVLVFNGEIYNHHKIRQRLEQAGVSGWRGHSDTETLLAAIEAWGLEQALTACEGMFALALWDRHARCLSLARDRMGEKPLYYGWSGPALLFGSELKALCRHRHWQGEINRVALAAQMSFSYIPEPLCIYQGTHKLEQGCLLQVPAGTAPGSRLESRRWWSLSGQIQSRTAARQAAVADPVAVVNAMESLLGEVVGAQMLADVPLGAFLSGGVDSSLIVALMQQQSGTPIRTFTIGFDEQDFDEAPFARAVAQHLGTRHTELTARPSDALEIIPQLPQLFDEPFSDMSQLPTFLVARLARSQVTVSLSGDGADELFGGYNRYFYAHSLWARMNAVPAPLRRSMAGLIRCARPGQWDRVFGMLKPVTPFRLRFNEPGQKMYKVADILQVDSAAVMYQLLTAHWADPEQLVRGLADLPELHAPQTPVPEGLNLMEHMMFLDSMSYLPGDILAKVDRTAMASSLETRAPYLNHRVVEQAWSLPLDLKIRDGQGKWILRQILYRHVPRALIERPKKGFGVPMGQWLRGSLRDWAEALLQPARLAAEGFFEPAPVLQKWREHVQGIHDWQYHLWDVLVFQAWLEQQAAMKKSALAA